MSHVKLPDTISAMQSDNIISQGNGPLAAGGGKPSNALEAAASWITKPGPAQRLGAPPLATAVRSDRQAAPPPHPARAARTKAAPT